MSDQNRQRRLDLIGYVIDCAMASADREMTRARPRKKELSHLLAIGEAGRQVVTSSLAAGESHRSEALQTPPFRGNDLPAGQTVLDYAQRAWVFEGHSELVSESELSAARESSGLSVKAMSPIIAADDPTVEGARLMIDQSLNMLAVVRERTSVSDREMSRRCRIFLKACRLGAASEAPLSARASLAVESMANDMAEPS